MNVSAIAIIMGNNNFGNTFRPLLESVMRVIAYHGTITEEQARAIIRDGIDWHYKAFQSLQSGAPGPGTLGYLGSARILFNDAAREDAATKDHDGGAWFLNVDMGEVYAY